ncbi:hypothetical protein [Exiguobacterium profundum]|uniref:hypothetical protein n=1 Tax=Exiguobacterium profundum TaxID=307643 RepID=UPI002AA955F9|nr:hypothetical protein [Exiguobacterium profundum]
MINFSEESVEYLFGSEAKDYLKINRSMLNELSSNNHEYSYMDNEYFCSVIQTKGISYANKILAYEILQRAYIATVTGYLRQDKWIRGILSGIENENYHAFASTMRAYIESATDLFDGLNQIPMSLAENYIILKSALNEEVDEVIIKPGKLEELLIHFQEARKNHNYSEKFYSAKSAKKYMESTPLKDLKLYEIYGELCEITHPASNSLDIFLENNNNNKLMFVENDQVRINNFFSEYGQRLSELFLLTDNLCLIVLKLINKFNIEEMHCKTVEVIDLSDIKLWGKIEEKTR